MLQRQRSLAFSMIRIRHCPNLLLITLLIILSVVSATTNIVPIRLYGLNYNTRQGPDWTSDDLRCKDRQRVWTDLSQIKKMTDRVRLLSIIDCNQTELVLDVASELNMNVWIGLWVDEDESVFLDEISALENIISRGLLDTSVVLGITVGSEALHRGDVSLSELLDHMKQVRILLSTNGGGNLPVSIVDTSAQYRRYQDLREQADIYYMNIHPYFNWKDNNNINGAVDTLIGGASSILKKSSGGASKSLILGEVGWPSGGVRPGQEGRASPAHQLQYFVDFYCKVHIATDWSYYWFTGIDNDWRQASGSANNDIEGNWGFFRDDLELKDHFKDFVFDCNGDEQYSFTLTDWSPPVPPESCRAHTQCEGIGGNCCPSDDGIWLGCCENAPTDMPSTEPTKAPTPVTSSPSNSPTLSLEPSPVPPTESCSAHPKCKNTGLTGLCCPEPTGSWLECCDNAATLSPTTSQPTFAPTEYPSFTTISATSSDPSSSPSSSQASPTNSLSASPITEPSTPLDNIFTPTFSMQPKPSPTRLPTPYDVGYLTPASPIDTTTERPTLREALSPVIAPKVSSINQESQSVASSFKLGWLQAYFVIGIASFEFLIA